MLVYVATSEQIDHAFNIWIDEANDDDRRIVHQVYRWFMSSELAIAYSTSSGLTCFSLDDWLMNFREWVDNEIILHPNNATNINKWSGMLIDLITSDWGINQKLIVRECLDNILYSETE